MDTGSVIKTQQDSKARPDVFDGEAAEVIELSVHRMANAILQKTQKIVAI
jgi:hypothetical protein